MTENTLSRRRAWALTLVATFTMAVSYIDRQTLAVLAPTVTRALRISDASYGDLASAFSLAYLLGAPLAGRFIDRVGARRGLLGAVLTWSVVAGLHALVPGFGALFVLRIALGFAESPSFPGAAQTVHRALPTAERARGFGVLFTGSSIGAMIAPPVATWIEHRHGWRVAFLVTAIAGLVWVPVWLATAFRPDARRALDRAETPTEPVSPFWEVALHPAVLRAVVVVIAAAPAIAFVLLWGAKYLVRDYGLAQSDVGRYLWLPPLFFDLGALAFGDLASRRALRRGLDGTPDRALVGVAAVMAAMVGFMHQPSGPWGTMLIAAVAMAGGGALFALVTSDMLARVPPGAVSTAGGVAAAAQSLAYIVANPLIGRAVQHDGHYRAVVVALGAWVVPGCVAWVLWKPPPYRRPVTP